MTADQGFRKRLDDVVHQVAAPGREQTIALIASVVEAGGTSEAALLRILQDVDLDSQLRSNTCWLISRLDIPAAGAAIKEVVGDPSEPLRVEAASGLGLVPDDDAVDVLLTVLAQDPSQPVRQAALHALGVRSSPRSAADLARILQNDEEDAELRADAAEAMAHIQDERVVPALVKSLADPSPSVRYSAAYALGEQGDSAALDPLAQLAAHDHAGTPWGTVASQALRSIDAITDANGS